MVGCALSFRQASVMLVVGTFLVVSLFCGADAEEERTMERAENLARAEVDRSSIFSVGSLEAEAAVDRWVDFVADMSLENVRANVRIVYADSAYLNDTLKEVQGVAAIEEYFLNTLGATERVSAEILDVAESKGNYYLRWVMIIEFRNLNNGEPTRSIGMSHLRFDMDGKVVYHQDYWDSTSGFYQFVPILGRVIKAVKARF